jgi:hypothetical protein
MPITVKKPGKSLISARKYGNGVKSLFLTFGPDFPGETFRVLKEKEEKQFGEYRTRRLVLEV